MKNLVTQAGVAAVGSVLFLSTVGIDDAKAAVFIKASETFSVSNDVRYQNLGTGSFDVQFRSYDPDFVNGNPATGRITSDDSIISELAAFGPNAGLDVTDLAIVGSYTSEEVRGLTELNLQAYYVEFDKLDARVGQPDPVTGTIFTQEDAEIIKTKLITSATLSFAVAQLGGAHPDNQNPLFELGNEDLTGDIVISYYMGNGKEDLADYGTARQVSSSETPTPAIPGTEAFGLNDGFISTQGFKKGQKVSIGIADAVERALTEKWDILGFRFEALRFSSVNNPLGSCAFDSTGQASSFDDCGAITFNNFEIGAVPTPAAILPTLFGMGMAAIRKKKGEGSEEEAEA
ncbi:MAG: PTPA-CTERM sorting domain-containing protein [Limnothrix sp.]